LISGEALSLSFDLLSPSPSSEESSPPLAVVVSAVDVDAGAGVDVADVGVGGVVTGAGDLRRERKREATATRKLRRAKTTAMGVLWELANDVIAKTQVASPVGTSKCKETSPDKRMEGMPGVERGREDGAAARVGAVQTMNESVSWVLHGEGIGGFANFADQTISQFRLLSDSH